MKLKIAAVRDILRYRQLGLSYSEIANAIGCSKSSVKKYVDRAVANNVEHSVAAALSDSSLGDILQPRQRNLHGQIDPDWQAVFLEHTQKDFSLKELWQNYVELVGEEHASIQNISLSNSLNTIISLLNNGANVSLIKESGSFPHCFKSSSCFKPV